MNIDWNRYNELQTKSPKDLTDEEREFFKFMYHAEEVRAGLDGDE